MLSKILPARWTYSLTPDPNDQTKLLIKIRIGKFRGNTIEIETVRLTDKGVFYIFHVREFSKGMSKENANIEFYNRLRDRLYPIIMDILARSKFISVDQSG